MRPINDNILIKVIKEEAKEEKVGSIIVPGSTKDKPLREGLVIRVSEELETTIKEGDKVLYGIFAGVKVLIDNEEHLLVKPDDIFAIL